MRMTLTDLAELYRILDDQTPLTEDCGRLCGAACCKDDGETLCGVDLLPAEADSLSDVDWADIVEDPVSHRPMLMCKSACDRSRRPWLCRIFPLCPTDNGKKVRIDSRSHAVCPLASYGLKSFHTDFKKAVAHSAAFLSSFEDGVDFLTEWENAEKKFREPLW